MSSIQRLLPRSEEAEKAVLFAMLAQSEQLLDELIAAHTAEHFDAGHAAVFEAAVALREKKRGVDPISVMTWLRDNKRLEEVGGESAVLDLATYLPTLAQTAEHSRIVGEKFRLRKMIQIFRDGERRAFSQEEDVTPLLEEIQGDLLDVAQSGHDSNSLRHVKEDLFEGIARIEARYEHRGKLDGLATGFNDLDRMLDGLKKACVYVIAGRPAMGKTSFGLAIGEHIALECAATGEGVAIFSIEMTREQVVDRIFAAHAEVTQEKIRRGFLSARDFDRLNAVVSEFAQSRLFIDDTGGLTTAKFAAQARRAVLKHKCKLIVVDHVLLMKGVSKASRANRQAEMNEIMECIASTAKALKVPIIALAQINRTGEDRKENRPTMADIKESGSIEEWAYMVGILYRPIYYAKTDAQRAAAAEKLGMSEDELATYAELMVDKHRNGATGIVKLKFTGEFTRYEDTADAKRRGLYTTNTSLHQGAPAASPEPEEGGEES